jgi:phage shock protein E
MRIIRVFGLLLGCLLHHMTAHAAAPESPVWIDVRTPAEYASGHVPQAQLIPFDGIDAGVAKLGLAKDTTIYLYCAVGGRAEKAKQSLKMQGYTNVTNLGGLNDAMQFANQAKPY